MKSSLPKNAKLARRGVAICGYGNDDFEQFAVELAFVVKMFETSGHGHFETAYSDDYRGHMMISANNNYFTSLKAATHETYRPFTREEDPFDRLNWCAQQYNASQATKPGKDGVVRISENDVLYYQEVFALDANGL